VTAEAKPAPAAAKAARPAPAAPKDRGVLVHLGLLVVAALSAFLVWTRDKDTKTLAAGDVTVWSGRAADVKRVTYEGKTRKVLLEVKHDDKGDYWVGSSERDTPAPKAAADAGAPAEKPPPTKTTTALVSVGEGEKLAQALAPLKALRDLGKVADDRLKEFGLDQPDGTLTVDVGGAEHKLVVGGSTPGSGDRYVKDAATGAVYALKGDLVRDLESADSRMVERDLHEWKDNDVQTATLAAAGKTREIVRGGVETKRFWADKASRDTNDETLGNWMSKLERLRPSEYVTAPPGKLETVLKLEFFAGRSLGFVELAKAPGDKGKSDYFVRSERTRLWAKVPAQTAEQVEADLAGVLK
jgi:Domain of unknown function (DUF4340)